MKFSILYKESGPTSCEGRLYFVKKYLNFRFFTCFLQIVFFRYVSLLPVSVGFSVKFSNHILADLCSSLWFFVLYQEIHHIYSQCIFDFSIIFACFDKSDNSQLETAITYELLCKNVRRNDISSWGKFYWHRSYSVIWTKQVWKIINKPKQKNFFNPQ